MPQCRKPTAIEYATYLESEQVSPIEHELIDGELFAITGGSVRHDLVGKRRSVGRTTRVRLLSVAFTCATEELYFKAEPASR